jgi:hypothetical protein
MPYTLAVLMFVGAAILGVGTTMHNLRGETVGLVLLMAWYLTLSVSFAGAIAVWIAHGAPGGPARPSLYAPLLYGHLAAVMAVHLFTLRRMLRARKRR